MPVPSRQLGAADPRILRRNLKYSWRLPESHFHAGSFPACKEAFARAAEVARGLRAWDSFASAVLGLTGHPQDALVRQPDSKLLALVEEALAMHREDDSLSSMLLAALPLRLICAARDSSRANRCSVKRLTWPGAYRRPKCAIQRA